MHALSLLLLVIYDIFALAAVIYHPTHSNSLFILGSISPIETRNETNANMQLASQTCSDIQKMTTDEPATTVIKTKSSLFNQRGHLSRK